MSDFVSWSEKYATGIPIIDNEHKKLVVLCNNLYESLLANQTKENWQKDVKIVLDKCTDYASKHFRDEEKLMRSANFEGYAHHKSEHDDFERRIRSLLWCYSGMSIADAFKFSLFLRDWILSHIAHEDKLYISKLKEYLQQNASVQNAE